MEILAPPLSYYDDPFTRHDRTVFVDDLQSSVLLHATVAYTFIFKSKPYTSVEDVSGRLDNPVFVLGDIGRHRLRSSFYQSLIAHVVKHLAITFLPVYETMFAGDECFCLRRSASAANRVDRFPRLCSFIQSQMQSQLPLCLQRAAASFEQCAASLCGNTLEQIERSKRSEEQGTQLFDLLDSLMHDAAMKLIDEVTKVLSGLGNLLAEDESLWEEDHAFQLERVRLESTFNRLQAQKLRLEACMAQKDQLDRSREIEHSLRHAVDAAVADASITDSMPTSMPLSVWIEIFEKRMDHLRPQDKQALIGLL